MDRKKFLDFMDMVDGGGAGQTGDKFQGGGLFSALANAVATPYGSEDDERMKAMMERRMAAGLIDRPQAPAPQVVRSAAPSSAPDTTPMPQLRPDEEPKYSSVRMAPVSDNMSPMLDQKGMTHAMPLAGFQEAMLQRSNQFGNNSHIANPLMLQPLPSIGPQRQGATQPFMQTLSLIHI